MRIILGECGHGILPGGSGHGILEELSVKVLAKEFWKNDLRRVGHGIILGGSGHGIPEEFSPFPPIPRQQEE